MMMNGRRRDRTPPEASVTSNNHSSHPIIDAGSTALSGIASPNIRRFLGDTKANSTHAREENTNGKNYYFSRQFASKISTNDLPTESGEHIQGIYSPWGIFFFGLKFFVPLAYIYIILILMRELCDKFPDSLYFVIKSYLPYLARVVDSMQKSSVFVEVWVVLEAIFFICLKLHIQWLQCKDPLEASLSAAPMLELHERKYIWDKMMEIVVHDPISFVSGWFFDAKLEDISRYDIFDFLTWCMFEGRNQEHLTKGECDQLDSFVREVEWRLSLYLYGPEPLTKEYVNYSRRNAFLYKGQECENRPDDGEYPINQHCTEPMLSSPKINAPMDDIFLPWNEYPEKRVSPRKQFKFRDTSIHESFTFFTNLYNSLQTKYAQYKDRVDNHLPDVNFHPVQGLKKYMAVKRQQIYEAEEYAISAATNIYEHAYFSFIEKGSNVDKKITSISNASQHQLTETWNSLKNLKERLETAQFIADKQKTLHQQLKGYRALLDQMRQMSSTIPTKQMATVMKKITQCNEALHSIENTAMNAFANATGFAKNNLHPSFLRRIMYNDDESPRRYAKYSTDPLLGLATYPLIFHVLILSLTNGVLRLLLMQRGFRRFNIGTIYYYYHPGEEYDINDIPNSDRSNSDRDIEEIPFVFCHGIGIGLITYIPLVDELLKSKRPILLPDIPYASGFQPWQSPNSILPPTAVSSTLSAMLASHGFMKGIFLGHSYGTSWLSYMCKYSPDSISALLFLDPICFCLHHPTLTKSFVYQRADIGQIGYMVRTDVMINWTIQRSFPWSRILLFTNDLPQDIPCAVFLSSRDDLIPAKVVEDYLKSKGAQVKDFNDIMSSDTWATEHFASGPLSVTIFRGDLHGDWTLRPTDAKGIALAANVLSSQASS